MKHVGVRGNAKDVVSQEQLIASSISNTPAGNIAATTVQAAINELDSEKIAKAGDTGIGALTVAGLLSSSGVIGYTTGAGGTATQPTSKSTAVTLNKPAGQITMNSASLAAGAAVEFQLNNSFISTNSVVTPNIVAYPSYTALAKQVDTGLCVLRVVNLSAGTLAEPVVVNFSVGRAATS